MFHILVVDDDKHTRKLIEAVLKTENYTVYTAENGEPFTAGATIRVPVPACGYRLLFRENL